MKHLTHILLIIMIAWFLSGCAITHEYGPYMGKVVEKETGIPIEGAVVFMQYHTFGGIDPGGGSGAFIDAEEVMTDKKGEFIVRTRRLMTFSPFKRWQPASVIIFKPGYGAYPGHKDTSPKFGFDSLPVNQHVTIKLPMLKTKKEREDNVISNLWFGSEVSSDKYKLFEQLKKAEINSLDKGR